MKTSREFLIGVGLCAGLWTSLAQSAEKVPDVSESTAAEDVDVENIKNKYWATGDESEMGVVQNRLYSKARKFQLGVGAGFAASDPFLSIHPIAVYAGYNFSEFWGFNINYMKFKSGPSSALVTLRAEQKEAPTVAPNHYIGGEITSSLLYGKLSLVGKKILYYDMYLTAGGGQMKVETGSPFAYTVGLGQRFFVNQWLSVKVDYKAMHYSEMVIGKEGIYQGKELGKRGNWTHTIVLGFDTLFGAF